MANEAIGILFEVQGGGDINKESGRRINGQLRHIVGQINKTDTVKLKFQIDSNHIDKQIKQLQKQLSELSSAATSSGGNKSANSSSANQQSSAYKDATRAIKEYYSLQAKYDRKSSRTKKSSAEYVELKSALDEATVSFRKYVDETESGKIIAKKNIEGLSDSQIQSLNELIKAQNVQYQTNKIDVGKNAEQAWSNLTQKVHDYIDRVEFAASRDKYAAEGLKKLRELANNTDYHGYDELKKQLAEVQQYINENSLATETWGQKMIKTFGSRVRSAVAGIITAKIAQYIGEIYNNVVKLDQSLVNLQIATGKTRDETRKLIKDYADLAKQLGATTAEVAESADTWLRQGYEAEQAKTLIANSTKLSKLGQMEAAEASKALTSAMKGYKVEVEDSIKIVDKFTAVDMEAAASAGDIATAMAETATSAGIAGVSMDKLIGYITTVKEVTQDGAESVGTFYKTLFARMNNVAAGKFIDDETGESLNDVETVLGELGIKLRGLDGQFRKSSDVLDEVADRWDSFDNVAQHAIATAFAGTRQQEKFIVLMENYGSALKYAETAANSAGTANEKYGAWLEGIDGKLNTLKATFEELSMSVLNSELITGTFEFITWLLDALTKISDAIGGLNTVLYATAAVMAIIKADSFITFSENIFKFFTDIKGKMSDFVITLQLAREQGMTMGASVSEAFNMIGISASSAQIAVSALIAIISAAVIVYNVYNSKIQESINNHLSNARAANQEGKECLQTAESVNKLIKEYEELAKTTDGAFSEEAAEKVKNIQDRITKLVGQQAENIDLVNGKLDEEIRKMRELANGTGGAVDNAITKGKTEIAEASKAYRELKESIFGGPSNVIDGERGENFLFWTFDYRTDFTKEWVSKYNIELDKVFNNQSGSGFNYALQDEFDDIESFISQYEKISAMYEALASEYGDTALFEAASDFISNSKYKAIYEQYTSGQLLIEEAEKVRNEVDNLFKEPENNGVIVAFKSAYKILEEVQAGYDGIAEALTDVTSEGYLTAGALSTLFKLEKDNALAGLKLSDILTKDANGYKLAGDALQQYVQALITAYQAEWATAEAFATDKDKENAIANLETLRSVLATLIATQEDYTDASKARREELEKEQEMYENQLDKFDELIELRKDLLQTYKDEVDYQKELEKRQRNVTALQTKLAVARLDQSAAGQARVRELEAELKEAQDDLDDFTLEHAIDVLTEQLDSTNAEWKALIQGKLTEITSLLESLGTTLNGNITIDMSWAQGMITQIDGLIQNALGKGVTEIPGNGVVGGAIGDAVGGTVSGATQGTYDQWESYWFAQNPGVYGPPPPMPNGWVPPDEWYKKYTSQSPTYHSGGFVGGDATISSNEEFAKLLKGEFVTTPAQMKRFMERTLPQITSYSTTNGKNEFNAPLVEITCESVTTESLPKLERIVNEAVKEVQRQLDNGMSRTGFKQPRIKRLTV